MIGSKDTKKIYIKQNTNHKKTGIALLLVNKINFKGWKALLEIKWIM